MHKEQGDNGNTSMENPRNENEGCLGNCPIFTIASADTADIFT
jgi:hypothetical protein